MFTRAKITGTGSYLPPKILKNDDLKPFMDVNDEWIYQVSGIRQRHYAETGVYTSDLALEASKTAIEDAGLEPEDIECIIFATLSPDIHMPGTGVFLQDKLGIADKGCACYDIRQQCSGFVYAVEMAKAFIEAGQYQTILVVGAEIHSSGIEYSNRGRDVTILFGDGASAVIFQAMKTEKKDEGLFYAEVHADGRGAFDGVYQKVFDSSHKPALFYDTRDYSENHEATVKMSNPRKLFTNAVIRMADDTKKALDKMGLSLDDVDWVLAHQANLHIIRDMGQRMKIDKEKVLMNIHKYANTSAATIPLLLDEYIRNGTIQPGHLVVFTAFGAGFTWGTALLRY